MIHPHLLIRGASLLVLLSALQLNGDSASSAELSTARALGYWPLHGDFSDAIGQHDGSFEPEGGGPATFVAGAAVQALDLRRGEGFVGAWLEGALAVTSDLAEKTPGQRAGVPPSFRNQRSIFTSARHRLPRAFNGMTLRSVARRPHPQHLAPHA